MELMFDDIPPDSANIPKGSKEEFNTDFRVRKFIKSAFLEDPLKEVICTQSHVILHQSARQVGIEPGLYASNIYCLVQLPGSLIGFVPCLKTQLQK